LPGQIFGYGLGMSPLFCQQSLFLIFVKKAFFLLTFLKIPRQEGKGRNQGPLCRDTGPHLAVGAMVEAEGGAGTCTCSPSVAGRVSPSGAPRAGLAEAMRMSGSADTEVQPVSIRPHQPVPSLQRRCGLHVTLNLGQSSPSGVAPSWQFPSHLPFVPLAATLEFRRQQDTGALCSHCSPLSLSFPTCIGGDHPHNCRSHCEEWSQHGPVPSTQ
jgi:hypothetical protein